jgi:hypothetical protein
MHLTFFIFFQIFISDVDKVISSSPVCGKSFKTVYRSKSFTINNKKAITSEILTPNFDPKQYGKRKLSYGTTFKSAKLKFEAASEIQEYVNILI